MSKRRWRSLLDPLLRQSWSFFHPAPALYCIPALVLALASSLAIGQFGGAILAAAGAFSVGFGAFQKLSRLHAAPMLLAAICMSLSTAVGTCASGDPYLDAAVVALAAFSLGLAASFGAGPWWVLLQGAIFLVIAGSQPGDLREGSSRAVTVLAGGLGQTLAVVLLRRLAPGGFPRLAAPNALPSPSTTAEWLAEARRVLRLDSPEMRYALLLGFAAGVAVLITRRLALPNGYWAVLTVLLVLRRSGTETITRGVQRIAGTLVGAGAATLFAALLRLDLPALAALITVMAWCAYATQWVNYGTFSASVTAYVAFLLALDGAPEATVAAHRVVATLLGGVIGIGALALGGLRFPALACRR
jgi:hypothetical protein